MPQTKAQKAANGRRGSRPSYGAEYKATISLNGRKRVTFKDTQKRRIIRELRKQMLVLGAKRWPEGDVRDEHARLLYQLKFSKKGKLVVEEL